MKSFLIAACFCLSTPALADQILGGMTIQAPVIKVAPVGPKGGSLPVDMGIIEPHGPSDSIPNVVVLVPGTCSTPPPSYCAQLTDPQLYKALCTCPDNEQ